MGFLRSIAAHFDPSKKLLKQPVQLLDPQDKKRHYQKVGELGEKLARIYIKQEGLKPLYENYRAPTGGEVDIVARDKDVLVFLEVKTRSGAYAENPAQAVDEEKQRLIARGAMSWLRRLDIPTPYFRFDIVEVILREAELPQLNRIENAFQLPDGYYPP